MLCLTTPRLTLAPLSDTELESLMNHTRSSDSELADAYGDMLRGCRAHPQDWLWYTAWSIRLAENDEWLGDIGFKGPAAFPEIGYGLLPRYWGRGYATEAVSALCRWALSQPGVEGLSAQTASDNAASQRVLIKNGFYATGEMGPEGPMFLRKKEKE